MELKFEKELGELARQGKRLNTARVNFLFQEARLGIQLAKMAMDSKNSDRIEALLRQRSAAQEALQVVLQFLPTVDLNDEEGAQLESLLDELRSLQTQI